MDEPRPYSVTAAPNESLVRGRLVRVRPTPEGVGCIWDVEVKEAKDVDKLANLARSRVGETIEVWIHPDFKKKFKPGTNLEIRLFYQGDARSGAFFLKGDEARKIE